MNLLTPKNRNRRGMTLIEVCIAATISSLIAAMGIGLIYSLKSVNSATKTKADRQRIVARLADTFRADAHQAEESEIGITTGITDKVTSEEHFIKFHLSDQKTVCYTLADGEVLRCVTSGDKRVASDSFLFSNGITFDVTFESNMKGKFAVLTIHQKQDTKHSKRLPPIVAAVGTSRSVIEISLPPKEEAAEATEATEAKSEPEEGTDQ